jgi:hypothetical protein
MLIELADDPCAAGGILISKGEEGVAGSEGDPAEASTLSLP